MDDDKQLTNSQQELAQRAVNEGFFFQLEIAGAIELADHSSLIPADNFSGIDGLRKKLSRAFELLGHMSCAGHFAIRSSQILIPLIPAEFSSGMDQKLSRNKEEIKGAITYVGLQIRRGFLQTHGIRSQAGASTDNPTTSLPGIVASQPDESPLQNDPTSKPISKREGQEKDAIDEAIKALARVGEEKISPVLPNEHGGESVLHPPNVVEITPPTKNDPVEDVTGTITSVDAHGSFLTLDGSIIVFVSALQRVTQDMVGKEITIKLQRSRKHSRFSFFENSEWDLPIGQEKK